MTLHAEEGLPRGQQGIVGRAVRTVAVGAGLGHVGMLEYERPLKLHVATGAHLLDRGPLEEALLGGPVGFVTVDAGHLVLGDGMVGELGELHANLRMALVAEFGHLLAADLLLGALMQLMTVKTADVAVGVGAGAPELENGGGSGGMTLQADQGLGLGGDFFQRQ